MNHNSKTPYSPIVILPKDFVAHKFEIVRQPLSCSSAYLDPELAAFFQIQLQKNKISSTAYISRLLLKYRVLLTKFLPKNIGPKRLHQNRIEGRVRICFTPDVEDYWDLKMMSLSADVSIGMVVAVLVEMDRDMGSQLEIIQSIAAITNLADRKNEFFTIKLNLSTNCVERIYHFRTQEFFFTADS